MHTWITQEERDKHERRMMALDEVAKTMEVLRGFSSSADGRVGIYDFDAQYAAKDRCTVLLRQLFIPDLLSTTAGSEK